MILADGKCYDSKLQNELLGLLEDKINQTLVSRTLSRETVICAMDRLGEQLADGVFQDMMIKLGIDKWEEEKQTIISMLRRENVEYRIRTELGEDVSTRETAPPFGQKKIKVRQAPLGVLFHIAAGNVDGLPVFSVLEGLLTGNINVLKLPQTDYGLSLELLHELVRIEPELKEYVYVFDTSSSDAAAIKKMADMADGIVVWGKDETVLAARRFAPAGTRLIEWGHKLSFAYISGYENQEEELTALAEHIARTNQLLCSSCQTIFVDTEELEAVYDFCKLFLPYLERAVEKHHTRTMEADAERTLLQYNAKLEKIAWGEPQSMPGEFAGKACSLKVCEDHTLTISPMFGHCLVKRLPQSCLMNLRSAKGYLQTAGLICQAKKRTVLEERLAACGVVRITRAGNMSENFAGGAHDGEYPLRRYMRIVNVE